MAAPNVNLLSRKSNALCLSTLSSLSSLLSLIASHGTEKSCDGSRYVSLAIYDMNSCVEKKKENDEVDGCVCPISILFHFHVAYIIIYHIILFNSTYIDACRVG